LEIFKSISDTLNDDSGKSLAINLDI
jgi:hypothetical protein